MENQFGKVSELRITASSKDDRTILSDVYFTAPYKVMSPFEHKDGSVSVMLLSASAGIMAGDSSEFHFDIQSGSNLEFVSQSFEKIHKMEEGIAKRATQIHVAAGSRFFYHPLPVIPFAQSSFENHTQVCLEDDTAEFEYYEIISCGRSARGERFAYKEYLSELSVMNGEKLIFQDNTKFIPELFPMEGAGFYEGFTHLGNFLFINRKKDGVWVDAVRDVLKNDGEIQGGISQLDSGDYIVKILGRQAQKLMEIGERISKISLGANAVK
ncbi:MAG: urease accessory protein UreD [Lachnospiraceae bacterium]|nr:urease accessory protein UreD [Lachnospiraceae bacterium]